ncbi:MAG: VOC family protein [Bacteroidetes bacterium]|nr:VOC family protein [Bacteroidota bacterium]
MTQLIAYLHFSGQCREALTFYQQCIGGELNMQKIAESPMGAQMPSDAGANILHATLKKDGITIVMGSDMMGARLKPGNSVALCLNCSSNEELNKCFDRLSSGGLVTMPPHQSFWGSIYGELTDRYGISWMLNYTKN